MQEICRGGVLSPPAIKKEVKKLRRKRKSRKIRSTPIIYITAIISLSLMGVGYGMWTDGLNINVNLTTGNIRPNAQVKSTGYGDLNIDVSEDGQNILLSGEVYPSFNEDITIKILDNGTVPVILDSIKAETSEIAELSQQKKARYGLLSSMIKDDVIEIFNLSISPPESENENVMMRSATYSLQAITEEEDEIQSEINQLEREIEELEAEIERLNVTEHHEFKYTLNFIQGL